MMEMRIYRLLQVGGLPQQLYINGQDVPSLRVWLNQEFTEGCGYQKNEYKTH